MGVRQLPADQKLIEIAVASVDMFLCFAPWCFLQTKRRRDRSGHANDRKYQQYRQRRYKPYSIVVFRISVHGCMCFLF